MSTTSTPSSGARSGVRRPNRAISPGPRTRQPPRRRRCCPRWARRMRRPRLLDDGGILDRLVIGRPDGLVGGLPRRVGLARSSSDSPTGSSSSDSSTTSSTKSTSRSSVPFAASSASAASTARRCHSSASASLPSSSRTVARAANSAGLHSKARSGSSSGISSSWRARSVWPRSRRAPDMAIASSTRTAAGRAARSTARPTSSARSGRPTPRSLSTMRAIWSSLPEIRR